MNASRFQFATVILGLSLVLAACAGSIMSGVSSPTSVAINGFKYVEPNLTIKVGTEVTIAAVNSHPLVGVDEGNNNPIPTTASTVPVTAKFTKAGTYKYHCQVHDGLGMIGTITVTE
jgi:plastocyanin